MIKWWLVLLMTLWNGEKVVHTEGEWRAKLGEERYFVMRQKGTEKPFSSRLRGSSFYRCAGCDLPLFHCKDFLALENGWPNFSKPISPKNVYYLEDWELGFKRYEVLCRGCDSHLGHVFQTPSKNTLRYCVNGIALH